MVTSLAAQTDSSISFLAQLLAALQFAQQTLSPTRLFRQDEFQIDDRKVSVRLVMPTGDAYRVTVEWISEDSP